MSKRTHAKWLLVSIALLCSSGRLAGQTASLAGTVTDKSNAVVPGVSLTATHLERNLQFQATSDAGGRYAFQSLPIGRFAVEAKASGFKLFRQTGIELTVDFKGLLNISLEVGDFSQSIDVQAQASRVDTQTNTIQQLVDSKRVEQLPLNGRNVYQLARLVPGTGTSGFAIGGGREGTWGTTTNVRLDGGTNTDGAWFVVQPSPSPDAVQEFTIQTSVPSAKYGWSAGVIEIATRSGTNALHGSVYDFLRNDALDARNFFAKEKTRRKRNQYGIAAGGPLWIPKLVDGRNKLFWFVNWEQQKEPVNSIATIFVPTALEAKGDFSASSKVPKDPLTNQPFPGNMIPQSRIDPISQNIFERFVPAPQDATGLYRFQYPADNKPQQVMGRIDYQVGNNQFMYRTFWTDNVTSMARGNLPYFSDAGRSILNTINDTFSFTRIVSPRIINLFRFSYNTKVNGNYPVGNDKKFPLEELRAMGWSSNFYSPVDTLPQLAITGLFTAGGNRYLWADNGDIYTVEDEMSWNRGRHAMELGFRFGRVNQRKDNEGFYLSGAYTFNGQFSGSALADFILGRPSNFTQQSVRHLWNEANSFAWYFQDTIKATPRLTVNFGLRYELPIAPSSLLKENMFFIPGSTQRSQRFVNAPPGLLFVGDPGMPSKVLSTPTKEFGPRVGIAYSLTGDQKTVLRAGYGILYNPSFLQLESNFSQYQPFLASVSLSPPPSTSNPWLGYPGGNPFPGTVGHRDFVFQVAQGPAYAQNYTDPQMQHWHVDLQREVAASYLFKIAYVGTKGTHLLLRSDLNAARYIPGQSTVANLNSRRPFYPPTTIIDWLISGGNSSYHSAQFSLDKRFSRGFSVLSSYTFSKALDNASDGWPPYPQDPDSFSAERSPSSYNRTHVLVNSFVWSVPEPANVRGALRHLLGGWEATGILSIYSGPPIGMSASVDRALRGLTNRPDRLRDARLDNNRPKAERLLAYFDRTAYAANQTGTFGSAPRVEGQLRGPGSVGFDLGLRKEFRLTDLQSVQFRTEFFNLPNHANFSNPGGNIDSSGSFGRITGAGDPRIIQFALKYVF